MSLLRSVVSMVLVVALLLAYQTVTDGSPSYSLGQWAVYLGGLVVIWAVAYALERAVSHRKGAK